MKPHERRSTDAASFSVGWFLAIAAAIAVFILVATGVVGFGNDHVCDCGSADTAGAPAAQNVDFGPLDSARNVSTRMIVEALDLGLHDLALAVSRSAAAYPSPQVMQEIATLKNMIALQDVKNNYGAIRLMLEGCLRARDGDASS